MKMQFNDGVEFDTDGPLRIEERYDGLYVVGQGMLLPVEDEMAAKQLIRLFKESKDHNLRLREK